MIVQSNRMGSLNLPTRGRRPDPDAVMDRGDDFVIAALHAMEHGNADDVGEAVKAMQTDPDRFASTIRLAQGYLESRTTIERPVVGMQME